MYKRTQQVERKRCKCTREHSKSMVSFWYFYQITSLNCYEKNMLTCPLTNLFLPISRSRSFHQRSLIQLWRGLPAPSTWNGLGRRVPAAVARSGMWLRRRCRRARSWSKPRPENRKPDLRWRNPDLIRAFFGIDWTSQKLYRSFFELHCLMFWFQHIPCRLLFVGWKNKEKHEKPYFVLDCYDGADAAAWNL